MSPPVSPDELGVIADRLDLELTREEAERFSTTISQVLDIYAPIDEVGHTWGQRDHYRIEKLAFDPPNDNPYNAYITKFSMTASDPDDDSLQGMDVAVKDNIAIAGIPMTCGSRVLEAATPQHNATVVDRLLESGAHLVGKTNQNELAFGPAGRHRRYGLMLNPVNPDYLAGGSSGGSAAAVAAGDVEAALGTDTGGSVRVPAALCGTVGFKPTWGSVPRFGFVEMAYSLDHIGPIATDVTTTARVFDVIGGEDRRDPTSHHAGQIPLGRCATHVAEAPAIDEFSLGVPESFFEDHVDEAVRSAVRETLERLEGVGTRVESVSLSRTDLASSITNAILVMEFAAWFLRRGTPLHRRETVDAAWHEAMSAAISAHGNQFSDLVKTKAIEGLYLLTRDDGRAYVRARNARALLEAEFRRVLESFDALVTPTVPTVAPAVNGTGDDNPDEWAIQLVENTRAANLTGFPALSVPCGEVDNLPIGIQFMGAQYDDALLLQLGRAFERFRDDATT